MTSLLRHGAHDVGSRRASVLHTNGAFTTMVLALTFSTGVIDAASYIGLHQVFTANMTGNVVFAGLGLSGVEDIPVFRAVTALGSFLAGAFLVGRLQRGLPKETRCPTSSAVTLVVAGCGVLVSGVLYAVLPESVVLLDGLTAVLGLAMGAQAAVARRIAVSDVSTVVVTMTLASWMIDGPLRRDGRAASLRRFGAVTTMVAGAVTGALVIHVDVTLAFLLCSALMLAVAGAAFFARSPAVTTD